MRSPVPDNDRGSAEQAEALLQRKPRAAREGRVPRKGGLVELARETSRRLRRANSPRAI